MNEEFLSASRLILESSEAALATLEEGMPYVSGVGYVANEEDGEIVVSMLMSDLSRHTKNVRNHPEVSLLVIAPGTGPIHERSRSTAQGSVVRVEDPERFALLKRRYIEIFPNSEMFFSLPDFRFYDVKVRELHWIGGFGLARTFRRTEEGWTMKEPVRKGKPA